ncbi:oligoendopeptidase F [Anaerocolumna jejuensis DSM 15929]|uniref:Oligopeptidase F n=1 Tax=Anaerocolumna jejuensis DSM 15929 TaxID=1121322 RepID=A0A1M6NZQ3_9FIRM|nr:oligoendopeptidase F [Anaerocolumna jejuensis]SHK01195.1 oligoendopeptidase F [Anaerocolumna jejuensis DSM 15929]
MEQVKLKKRSEMDSKYKWSIEDLFANDELWKEEYIRTKEEIEKVKAYQGKLCQSGKLLYDFLKLQDDLSYHLQRVYVYANQKYHEDTGNSIYQGFSEQAGNLIVAYESAVSFANAEILSMPEEVLFNFVKNTAGLSEYEFALNEILRNKPYTLSGEMEELLALAGDMASSPKTIFSMFNNADIKFPSIRDENGELREITHGSFILFLESPDRRVRKEAFQSLYATYMKNKNTLAAVYSANVKKEAFYAKARKFPSTMAMKLYNSNIPVEVYKNLIETVHEKMSLMHRYVALRKKLMELEELHVYDLYTPIVKDVDIKYSFEEAKELVIKGLAPLGEKYREVLLEGFRDRWIDVYENQGKRSGAYSWGAYGTHPYVLLNYNNSLDNVFTLAHEMGHAMHSYYSNKTQPIIYADYKIFVAEVASTCNEALLMEYMLSRTDDKKQKAYLINHFLEQFRTTLYRQTMFAEFEMLTHEKTQRGEALTAETLSAQYRELVRQYYGEELALDEEISFEWSRIPHFYTPFYVYQYATGYSAAIALSRKILKEGESAVEDYIGKFLSGGNSDYPIELLKKAGVDMGSKEPVRQALDLFEELLDEMEGLMA